MWHWSLPACAALFGAFLLVDVGFFSANIVKIVEGGWFPLAFGLGVFVLMSTWKRGRELLSSASRRTRFRCRISCKAHRLGCTTVPGTAVFMTANPDAVPHALLHSLKHYKSLHERVVLLTAVTLDVPHVPPAQHVAVEPINAQFHKVKVFFGFMDDPDLPEVLEWCAEQGLRLDMMDTSFFLGRETLVPTVGADMALWREKLFVAMYRNAGSLANYFNLPPNRVVELGRRSCSEGASGSSSYGAQFASVSSSISSSHSTSARQTSPTALGKRSASGLSPRPRSGRTLGSPPTVGIEPPTCMPKRSGAAREHDTGMLAALFVSP